MGDYGETNCVEDDLFAEYLATVMEGGEPDFNKVKSQIKTGSLRNVLRNIFLRKHIESCLQLNTSKNIPVLQKGRLVPV